MLGVQVLRDAGERPAPAPVAGWEFALDGDPLRTTWTPSFRSLYGIDDGRLRDDEVMGLADLYRRIPRPSDVARLLAGVATARPGDVTDGTIIVRHDDGALRLVRFVRRVVEIDGRMLLRGLDHDVTATRTGDLAISMLDVGIASTLARSTGTTCVLTDASTGLVITWVSDPPAGLDSRKAGVASRSSTRTSARRSGPDVPSCSSCAPDPSS